MSGDLEGEGGVIVAAPFSWIQLLVPLFILPRLAGEEGGQSLGGLFGAAEISALAAHSGYGRQIKPQIVSRLPGREIGGVSLQRGDTGVLHALHDNDALRRGHERDVLPQHPDIPAVIEMVMGEKDGGDIERGILA
jgi:hypothetical protein